MDDTLHGGLEVEIDCAAILRELDAPWDVLPKQAILSARLQPERMIPHLIEAVRTATRRALADESVDGSGYFHAVMLLWEFGAKEAFPAILESMSLPDEWPDTLYGELVTEYLPRILATLGDDNVEIVAAMIDDPQLDEFVRWAAVHYFVYLVRDGRLSRDEVVGRLRRHLRTAIDRGDDEITTPLILCLLDLFAVEVRSEIDEAFRRDLVDRLIIDARDVVTEFARGQEHFDQLLANRPPTRIADVIDEMQGWATYNPEKFARDFDPQNVEPSWRDDPWSDEDQVDAAAGFAGGAEAEPLVRQIRVGRNAPCPCGSGKKFKKCCLKDESAA